MIKIYVSGRNQAFGLALCGCPADVVAVVRKLVGPEVLELTVGLPGPFPPFPQRAKSQPWVRSPMIQNPKFGQDSLHIRDGSTSVWTHFAKLQDGGWYARLHHRMPSVDD